MVLSNKKYVLNSDMWQRSKDIIAKMQKEEWAKNVPPDDEFWIHLGVSIDESILPTFLEQFSSKIKAIIEIDPKLPEKNILELVTSHIVDFLGADTASIRLYDPHSDQMLSYGSYPSKEESREQYISLEKSIAGKVVKTRRTYLVPDLMKEELFKDKSIIESRGAKSLMAIPLEIPRFFSYERDTVGVIQIYYPDTNRNFSPLEIRMAEIMSHRLSYVVARKKIRSMQMANEKKDAIVHQIYKKLGSGSGIKMKEVFNRVIPELVDIINIQSCALFSVANDMEHVILEAGYPDSTEHHGIDMKFNVREEPAFELVLNLAHYQEKTPYELVTRSYILVMDPQKSRLVSSNVKKFALRRNINSILYIPLKDGDEITHFVTFDAMDQRQGYSPEEIEVFLFLGHELTKAQRIERLDDILHDFKNPAIATAGFARRLKQLLDDENALNEGEKIKQYVDILLEETSRLQEMAMSISWVGKEQVVSLTEILKRRFEINREAIRQQLKQNLTLEEGPFDDSLSVKCFPLFLERIMDNLLNNATNAIPLKGGFLSIKTYKDEDWACAEISNTGNIAEEERLKLIEGEASGRGLYITHRIIRILKGKIDIRAGIDKTTMVVRLPLHRDP